MDAPKAGLRQRIFAWALARFNSRYEDFIAPRKKSLFAGISGTLIEIGPGTGVNLRYLAPERVQWIGIETNPFMRSRLLREADRLGMRVDMRMGTADSLPAADASVDAVVCTLVLCCVPDQQRSLREVLRVLKPGGTFHFIEHVAAPRGSRLRRIQNFVTPFWSRLGDGCHPNRETLSAIERAGFASVSFESIEAPPPIVSP
ncbi:MAG TPA: class I SAM-dependent methyltransferase, partial [Bryobacteraceae bacterium]|nr:class I SAM-dependent methyltransferase [Bryobacteraceae bacterium]